MQRKLKVLFIAFVISILLILPIIAHASPAHTPLSEEDTASEEETPAGIGEFFLLVGLGGVVAVGGARISREMANKNNG